MRTTSNLIYSKHPILPAADREEYQVFTAEKTIVGALSQIPYALSQLDVYVYVNDTLVPRTQWDTYKLNEGDLIVLKQRVHGGDGSNPLQIIAMIAVIALAAYGQGWVAGAINISETAAFSLIFAVGGALVNYLFPPVLPSFDDNSNDSPNYGLNGGRNRARVGQPLPLVVGKHRMVPDLASQPFTSQRYPDVYLHQIFNFGFGDLAITDVKIGETPIENHQDVTTEWSDVNGDITLIPGNVDSLAGGLIKYEDGWITRTSSIDTTQLVVELAGQLVKTDTEGKFREDLFYYQLQYREVGSDTWIGWETQSWLQDEREYSPRDLGAGGDGTPTGPLKYNADWANGESIIVHKGIQPVRRTFTKQVTQGQYEVRIRQSRPFTTLKNWQRTAEIQWAQLRSYQPDTGDYSNQTRLGVQIRASGQFNGSVDSLNAIVSARIPVWNGSSWTVQESSNPAFIFLYLAHGGFDANGKRLWGAGLPDAKIDIEGIKEWAAWCDTKGLECNFVFDRRMSVMDMLALVARTGRGSPTWQKGILGAV